MSIPRQLINFQTPFSQKLDPGNRWIKLADKVPWDDLTGLYLKVYGAKSTGKPHSPARVFIGALIIKHLCNLDDRETMLQITENIYMQYFLGYSAFSKEPPFNLSLFVEIQKHLGGEALAEMNLRIHRISL